MGKNRPARAVLAAAITLGLIFAALLPASALADSVATTEPATNVTITSATLNGLARPQDAATYQFKYWPAANPDASNTTAAVAVSSEHVSANVTGLMPATTYQFELIVVETYQETSSTHTGDPVSFTTPATPGTIATTGQATGITTTSADLNGVSDTSSPDSSWYFEYGLSTSYGEQTTPQPTGSGFTFVSFLVKDLTPRTRYHFRLVVLQGNVTPNYGADSSFVTANPPGHVSLHSHRLKVRHGSAAIRFRCSGQRGDPCQARVSLKAKRAGRHGASVSCGTGTLTTTAPHKQTIHVKLGSSCDALLKSAKHHRLSAKLHAVFGGHQKPLRTTVTLIKV